METEEIATLLPEWLIQMTLDPSVEPEFLPHPAVISCLHGTASPEEIEVAFSWLRGQQEAQDKAARILDILDEQFPVTRDALTKNNLPAWLANKWAMTLHIDWSRDLGSAVDQATIWLESHGIVVN